MNILGDCPACDEPVTDSESLKAEGLKHGEGIESGERYWHLECWLSHAKLLNKPENEEVWRLARGGKL